MLRKTLLLAITVALVMAASVPAATTSTKVPFNFSVFVPCAAGGAGEQINGTGTLHIVLGTTIDKAGGIHLKFHFQPQDLKSVGQTTGDVYQGNGITRGNLNINAGGLPITDNFVNNFRQIGPGPGNNYQVHVTSQITVNENGVLTAAVTNVSITCN